MLIEVSELGVGRRDPRTQTGLNQFGTIFGPIRSDPRIWRTVVRGSLVGGTFFEPDVTFDSAFESFFLEFRTASIA